MRAPFPYSGGKKRIAKLVYEKMGRIDTYIEPFAGSLAVLLGAPTPASVEVVGDLDGMITNVWRSIKWSPAEVAKWAGWPPNSTDLRARRAWLIERREDLTRGLESDPMFHDPKAAGWWLWGKGIWSPPTWPELPPTQNDATMRLHNFGNGVHAKSVRDRLPDVMGALARRLRHVRVTQGDWTSSVREWIGPARGLRGVLLDPPYHARTGRDEGLYVVEDMSVADEVAAWARERGEDPKWRIVLCGLRGEHDMPGWEQVTWDERSGETIWCSPHCCTRSQVDLFEQEVRR